MLPRTAIIRRLEAAASLPASDSFSDSQSSSASGACLPLCGCLGDLPAVASFCNTACLVHACLQGAHGAVHLIQCKLVAFARPLAVQPLWLTSLKGPRGTVHTACVPISQLRQASTRWSALAFEGTCSQEHCSFQSCCNCVQADFRLEEEDCRQVAGLSALKH